MLQFVVCFWRLVCEVDAQVVTSIASYFQMRSATTIISTGHTPIPLQDIQSPTPDKKNLRPLVLRTLENWEQNCVRSASVDFHNYANQPGRISIKVVSWTMANLASFCFNINSQLAATTLGEHLQKCKVIHINTCKHTENLAPLPLLSWPSLHVCFTHLRV